MFNHTFKKADPIVTMLKKDSVRIGSDTIEIDPQLLFQRLLTAGFKSGELEEVFKFELCSYPPTLFDSASIMSVAQKSTLAKFLKKIVTAMNPYAPYGVKYVLDGGALLQCIPCEKKIKFGLKYVTIMPAM